MPVTNACVPATSACVPVSMALVEAHERMRPGHERVRADHEGSLLGTMAVVEEARRRASRAGVNAARHDGRRGNARRGRCTGRWLSWKCTRGASRARRGWCTGRWPSWERSERTRRDHERAPDGPARRAVGAPHRCDIVVGCEGAQTAPSNPLPPGGPVGTATAALSDTRTRSRASPRRRGWRRRTRRRTKHGPTARARLAVDPDGHRLAARPDDNRRLHGLETLAVERPARPVGHRVQSAWRG